ncbi:MAG: hypothetical protein AMXMBFR33_01070 [Candidatus Xenobia bacterium]
MLKAPSDAIKIPIAIARSLSDLGLSGHFNWVTPRLLASLARKPFLLMRRGWSLAQTEPLGYLLGGKTVGQLLRIEPERGRAILDSRTADCWHRIVITLQGELVSAGPAYADGRELEEAA